MSIEFATAMPITGRNAEAERINAAYRAQVAHRVVERAYRDARAIARAQALVRISAWINYIACWIMGILAFYYYATAVQTHIFPTPPVVYTIGFLFVETCACIYIALFPRYIDKL